MFQSTLLLVNFRCIALLHGLISIRQRAETTSLQKYRIKGHCPNRSDTTETLRRQRYKRSHCVADDPVDAMVQKIIPINGFYLH